MLKVNLMLVPINTLWWFVMFSSDCSSVDKLDESERNPVITVFTSDRDLMLGLMLGLNK